MDVHEFVRWGDDLEREFQGASDRAAAVVGAAMLDAQLRILLEDRMSPQADRKELFDGANAPLHSLSGKTDLAFALGLISAGEHRNLVLIRRIRNIFAHRIGNLSFETQEISSRCAEIEVPIGMRLPPLIPLDLVVDENSDPSLLSPESVESPRDRFQAGVIYVSNCLQGRHLEVMGVTAEPRPDFKQMSELLSLQIRSSDQVRERIRQLQVRLDEKREQYDKGESLVVDEGTSEQGKMIISELKSRIDEQQREIDDLKQSEAHSIMEMISPLQQQLLRFVHRWESWVGDQKPSD